MTQEVMCAGIRGGFKHKCGENLEGFMHECTQVSKLTLLAMADGSRVPPSFHRLFKMHVSH